jgi:disulfide bond formation protein DsbB
VVDFDTLQAVIINRYDVLSQYARSLKQVYREELGTLQDGSRFKGLKPLAGGGCRRRSAGTARAARVAARREPCAANAYAMRQELVAVWERSNASREHLLRRCRTGASAPRTPVSGSCRNCRCACAAMYWPDRPADACFACVPAFGLLALAATGLTLAGWLIGELDEAAAVSAVHLSAPALSADRLLALAGVLLPGWDRLWGVLLGLTAAGGLATAAYQSWLQYLPDASMECGFGEPTLIEQIVDWFGVRWPALFMATGFCSSKDWVFLGLSMANWSVFVFCLSGRRCRTGDEARRVLETALKRRLPDQRMRCWDRNGRSPARRRSFSAGAFQACP